MTNLLQTPRPVGGFGCILADPPWAFETFAGQDVVFTNGVDQPYQTMDLAALKRLPVKQMAARDCVLLMWVVDANLVQALELGAAWGFTFKSRGLTWDKGKMSGGYWFRKESEMSLLFTRGAPARRSASQRDMIREKPREHSRKPDCQYDRLEALCRGPYLELFARTAHPGWTSWGNQVGLFQPNEGAQGDRVPAANAG